MSIIVKCGACGKAMRAHPEHAGMRGACRGCGAEFTIPGEARAEPAPPPPPPRQPLLLGDLIHLAASIWIVVATVAGIAAGVCLIAAGVVAGHQGVPWEARSPWAWTLARGAIDAGAGALVAWSFWLVFRWIDERGVI